MNFRRILANAVVRRVAALLVAAVLAWLGFSGTARAANECPMNGGCDQGAAYSYCMADSGSNPNNNPAITLGTCTEKSYTSTQAFYECRRNVNGYPVGGCSEAKYYFLKNKTCQARPDYVGTSAPYSTAAGYAVSGSITCNNGCSQSWYNNGDGTFTGMYSASSTVCTNDSLRENCALLGGGYFWNAYAGVCQPPKQKCSAQQTKDPLTGECKDACPAGMVMDAMGACSNADGECPAGNVKAPSGECLPGDGQCAAGEARRENGTCGTDSDGDGKADEDDDDPDNDPEKESASGGDTCDAPPSCSGGAIDCMQVKIQWRIDCNTRKNRNVSGGTCGAVPVCTGDKCDALEYASLLQQWRTACHLEKLANSGQAGGGTGSGSSAMDPVSSDGVLGDDLDPSTVQRGFGGSWNGEGEELAFDESGYGFARTCPTPPTIDVLGKSITFDTSVFCDWMRLGGVFVMIMAYLAGLSIVVRS